MGKQFQKAISSWEIKKKTKMEKIQRENIKQINAWWGKKHLKAHVINKIMAIKNIKYRRWKIREKI